MRWLGLTGGIASGKSTVTRLLRAEGIPVICADELAREVVKKGTPGYDEVIKTFGQTAIAEDGELNRKQIGETVFKDKSKLKVLEDIIHPKVRALAFQRRKELASKGHKVGFYDVPLLFEKNLQGDYDAVVVVSCDEAQQLKRLMERDQMSREEGERRLRAQMPLKDKVSKANFVIENQGSLEELKTEVARFLNKVL